MSSLILLPVFLLTIFVIFFRHFLKNAESSKVRVPPGPPRLPFIGNLHQLNKSCLHKCFWDLSRKYGPLMSLKLGSVPTLVVSSSKLAKQVLKDQDLAFCSVPQTLSFRKLNYDGLNITLAPYGLSWREMKKISVLHLLTGKRIKQFRPIREDELSRMMARLRENARLCKVTNLSEMMMKFSYTTISRMAFGNRWDEESFEKTRFDYLLHEAEEMFVGFFFSDYLPYLGWIDRLTGMRSRLDNIYQKLDEFYEKVIDAHLDPNRPKSMDDDLIDIMLQLQQTGSTSFKITKDHIKAMVLDMFIAGTETSPITVTWAMVALMKNPKVMRKLQAEIRGMMKGKEFLDEDDVEKLPYLKETVMETLRLYSPAPLMAPRETLENCNLDGYEIPPKTVVYINAWGIGRDPEVWEHAEEFSPERFLNSKIDIRGVDFEMIPFGSGRRICPGISMALVTVQLLLANLVHSFDWELPPGMKAEDIDTETAPGLTLNKKTAFKLVPRFPATN